MMFTLCNLHSIFIYYFVMLLVLSFTVFVIGVENIPLESGEVFFLKLQQGLRIASEVVFLIFFSGKQRLCTLAQNCK